ncbi:MAG: hypothetical protein CMH55_05955 [Myxococcales bacterium]|nr:hypothetical protein [Myxococcales bacterium]
MKDFFRIGQGIYALGLLALMLGSPVQAGEQPDDRLDRAAQQARDGSLASVRAVLAQEGYYPFLLRSVPAEMDPSLRESQGLIHCSRPRGGQRICGRIVARLLDASPLHFQVAASAGFVVHSAHLVMADGRTERLRPDKHGLIDVPPHLQQRWLRLGITVRGPDGPETGLFLAQEAAGAPPSPCSGADRASALVQAINRQRADLGFLPLRAVAAPQAYAHVRQKALKQRFAHPEEGLGPLLRSLDLRLRRAAELLAEDDEMAAVCEGWMQSPSHRAALLNPQRNRIALVHQGERVAALLWQQRD